MDFISVPQKMIFSMQNEKIGPGIIFPVENSKELFRCYRKILHVVLFTKKIVMWKISHSAPTVYFYSYALRNFTFALFL